MADLTTLKRKFGTTERPEEIAVFRVGQLSFELRGGAVGRILYGKVEVLRGISYLIRDENWGTCPIRLSAFKTQVSKNQLAISYSAKTRNGDSMLTFKARITVTPNRIEFVATAIPDKDFKTNRTGFVVLHPITSVAGKPLTVVHVDGTETRSRFPKFISPDQPFFDIGSLEHSPAPGLKAHVSMLGNKFEMEDQRNWGDASFKTYVCSLLDPWPYELKSGVTFTQRVDLQISGTARTVKSLAKSRVPIRLLQKRLPEIGLVVAADDAVATQQNLKHLRRLKPDFLTFTCEPETSAHTLQTYALIGREADLPTTVELILPGKGAAEAEVSAAAKTFAYAGLVPEAIVITQAQDLKSFQPTDKRPWGPSYEEMAAAVRKHFPKAKVGGGMLSYFTELNRKRPSRGVFDFITHSICPIVHDASDVAVMQTLEALPHIFASAKAIIGKTPYHIGPTTIAARMNPYGAAVTPNPRNKRVCLAANDPRQFGEFAVAWNKELIAEAARAGVKRITLGGLCGPRGLLDKNSKPTPLFTFLASLRK